jgi:hypothetical protein
MGFVADMYFFSRIGFEKISDIVVKMGFDVFVPRDHMDVNVKNPGRNKVQGVQSRFFRGLPGGYLQYIFFAIGMSAGLKPFVEFFMVHQQNGMSRIANDERRGCNVAGQEGSVEAVWEIAQERNKAGYIVAL